MRLTFSRIVREGLVLVPCTLLGQTPSHVSPSTIYKESLPSVVYIEAKNPNGSGGWTGTGFIVSPDGEVLTNYHVIRNSKEATIKLSNGDAYDSVEVLDVDRRKDIALLRIKAVGLHPLRLASFRDVQIGDTVFSVSNPLGVFNDTFSEGIVSGIRQMDGYRMLQITAPISHGSSGGPLFNTKGEVIGITSESAEAGQNLNFAVPVDYALGMISSPGAPRPLTSVYDPEPSGNVASTPTSTPGSAGTGVTATDNLGIDGSWSATFADSKASGSLKFDLIQNSGGEVVGTYTSSLGGGGKIQGLVTETDFEFELTQSIEGCPGIYKGKGIRTGNHIAGDYVGSDCLGERGNGTFTMNRVVSAVPGNPTGSTASAALAPQIPPEMKNSLGDLLASKLSVWTENDAEATLGEPLEHRYVYDRYQDVSENVYSFHDPTMKLDHVELGFDSNTKRLITVFLYPKETITWQDCKKAWGDDVSFQENSDGTTFVFYHNRRLTIFFDKYARLVNVRLY